VTTSTIVLLSGGLDSTVLATHMRAQGDVVNAVSIHYGQRHSRELDAARDVAAAIGIRHDVVDLSVLRDHLSGSALTDDAVDVPEGHYAEDTMRATVVPNRNAIMLSVAVGVAVARGFNRVATAVHAGDHFVYPDCRPEFTAAIDRASRLGTAGFGDVQVYAPFVSWSKADIAAWGHSIQAPIAASWSCYQGGDRHCGRCGTCVERHEAFRIAGVTDPTVYADATFAAVVAP
jgi:7-cyano-7-deazaguanine synthase